MEINLTLFYALYVLLAVAIGYYAKRKNRNPWVWAGFALVPGLNVVLLLFLFFTSPVPRNEDEQAAK